MGLVLVVVVYDLLLVLQLVSPSVIVKNWCKDTRRQHELLLLLCCFVIHTQIKLISLLLVFGVWL